MTKQLKTNKSVYIWVNVDPSLTIRFDETSRADAILITGDISSERLRLIRINQWEHIDPLTTQLPTWKQENAPAFKEIKAAAFMSQARANAIKECLDFEEKSRIPHPDVIEVIQKAMEVDFDSVNAYYAELARVIQQISPYTARVNTAICLALDIKPKTAAQYVNRCRKRGFLPPSKRSQK